MGRSDREPPRDLAVIEFTKDPSVGGTRVIKYHGRLTAGRVNVARGDVEAVLDEMLADLSKCAEDLGATHIVGFETNIELRERDTYWLSATGTPAQLEKWP